MRFSFLFFQGPVRLRGRQPGGDVGRASASDLCGGVCVCVRAHGCLKAVRRARLRGVPGVFAARGLSGVCVLFSPAFRPQPMGGVGVCAK